MGARLDWAILTKATICDKRVSLPTFSALKRMVPLLLIVEPITASPTDFSTGRLSPVTIDSSMVVLPSTIVPSTAIFSPGRNPESNHQCGYLPPPPRHSSHHEELEPFLPANPTTFPQPRRHCYASVLQRFALRG